MPKGKTSDYECKTRMEKFLTLWKIGCSNAWMKGFTTPSSENSPHEYIMRHGENKT